MACGALQTLSAIARIAWYLVRSSVREAEHRAPAKAMSPTLTTARMLRSSLPTSTQIYAVAAPWNQVRRSQQ